MSSAAIEEFAQILIREVRDAAVRSCDKEFGPMGPTAKGLRWKKAGPEGVVEAVARAVVPDCVDAVLFRLLNAIDNGDLQLSFKDRAGGTIDLEKEGKGELAGWYMMTDGWRGKYAKERFVDDFADSE